MGIRLPRLQRESFVEDRADGELVNVAAVIARDADRAAFTSGLDGVAQSSRAVVFQSHLAKQFHKRFARLPRDIHDHLL